MMIGNLPTFLGLFVLFSLATVIKSQEGAQPPMYEAHDFASEKLQQRRTIANGNPCDAEFGTDLEGVVNEMEDNREGDAALANKLKNKFSELMDKNPTKNLCVKKSWCDEGICKKREKISGRSMGDEADEGGNKTSESMADKKDEKKASAGTGITAFVSLILTLTVAVIIQ